MTAKQLLKFLPDRGLELYVLLVVRAHTGLPGGDPKGSEGFASEGLGIRPKTRRLRGKKLPPLFCFAPFPPYAQGYKIPVTARRQGFETLRTKLRLDGFPAQSFTSNRRDRLTSKLPLAKLPAI